jgi:hypothetical protein
MNIECADQNKDNDTKKASVPLSGRDHSNTPHVEMEMEVDPTMMDNLWAKELLELGVNEREVNDEGLHGIRSLAVAETPEMLNRTLNEMQKEIDCLPAAEKRGHTRGLELGSMYIQSLAFRLKFLRSVQFDSKTAAFRYCKCLEYMSELFGEYALKRRLYITDLSEEEISYMEEGQFQVLPSRDGLGRRIVVYNIRPTKGTYSIDCMFKAYAYILHAILSEDISTQKHGIVYIGIITRNEIIYKKRNRSTADLHRAHRMYIATPLYWGAAHLCVPNDDFYRLITGLFLSWLGQQGRKMLRLHYGNSIECNYSLRSFGIPVGDMPQMHTGQIKTRNHLQLMKLRMTMDVWQAEQEKRFNKKRYISNVSKSKKTAPEAIRPFPGIECPEVDFVVLAYSRNEEGVQNNHPGNIAFRKVFVQNEGFQRFLKDYDGLEFDRRSSVVRLVDDILFDACVESLQFLIYDKEKGYYTEVINQDDLRRNIEKAMRRYRRQFWANGNTCKASSSNSSSTIREDSSKASLQQQQLLDLSRRQSFEMDCSLCP